MKLYVLVTVVISQVLTLSYYLGFSRSLVVTFGTVCGALIGLLVFWSYSELHLVIQDLSRVDVSGKCVLITGCDSGFGLQLAESLVKKGMFVFAGVLNPSSTGASNLGCLSLVKVVKMDITQDEDVRKAFEVVSQHLVATSTTLWALVNNAGVCSLGMLEFVPMGNIRQLLEVNALGTLRVCQRFAPLLRGRGRIVNVTSVAGVLSIPFLGAYCASKFALEAIMRVLRIEMHLLNVPVITIQPAAYVTPLVDASTPLYGQEELQVYGQAFMTYCNKIYKKLMRNRSENTHEVIESLESAILNQKYQYNYIPNFKNRLLMSLNAAVGDDFIVRLNCNLLTTPNTVHTPM